MIRGRISSGVGKGQQFTRLDWAREQFIARLRIDPFPGTLNLIIDDPDSRAAWKALRGTPGIRIDNPCGGPNNCDGRCYPISLEGQIAAAIVLPEVDGYPDNQVEIIASIGLRDALGKSDGGEVVLEIDQAGAQQSVTSDQATLIA